MKNCAKCGEAKPLDGFSKCRTSRDGLQHWCKPCHRSGVRAAHLKNPDVKRANRALHMDKELASNRAYKAANKAKIKLQSKRDKAIRRAREFGAEGSFSKQDVADLFRKQRGKCLVCRCALGDKYHVDHVLPLAAGGANEKENLQLLCAPCNLSKGAKDPLVFMQSRGYLI